MHAFIFFLALSRGAKVQMGYSILVAAAVGQLNFQVPEQLLCRERIECFEYFPYFAEICAISQSQTFALTKFSCFTFKQFDCFAFTDGIVIDVCRYSPHSNLSINYLDIETTDGSIY
ncbi:hypothetical protein [Vibrio cholerae]|uniref:hypothetical protein n=1 Tax=Vibrio cholerae TaxID=666 RepID=UPI002DB5CE49|nr:hypothetical protein [Vibrio cholerae]